MGHRGPLSSAVSLSSKRTGAGDEQWVTSKSVLSESKSEEMQQPVAQARLALQLSTRIDCSV